MRKTLVLLSVMFCMLFSNAQQKEFNQYYNLVSLNDGYLENILVKVVFFYEDNDVIIVDFQDTHILYKILNKENGITRSNEKFYGFLVLNMKTKKEEVIQLFEQAKYGMRIINEEGDVFNFKNLVDIKR